MYADGSGLTQITHTAVTRKSALSPSWSSNGTQIAFIGTDAWGAEGDLYVIDVDGTNIVRLTTDFSPGPPAWSPNGNRIAFSSAEGRNGSSIYLINVDGTGLTRLTWGEDGEGDPAWSPDGARIAFGRLVNIDPGAGPLETYYAIHVMNADGSHIVQLTDFGLLVRDPAWSPDGTQIAFTCKQPDKRYKICVMNADGSNRRQLPAPTEPNPCQRMIHPTWSPDGQYIAFECKESVDATYIYVMNADGSGIVRLIKGRHPAWQPTP